MTRRLTGYLLVLAVALVSSCSCDDDPVLDISGSDGDVEVREFVLGTPPTDGPVSAGFSAPRPALRDVLLQLESVAESDGAAGVFLRVGPMAGAWGRIRDIAEALGQIREAGKPVHCHFEVADNASYVLMASACDRVTMTPAGHLDLVGVAAHVFYARTLLENLGLRAEILQMGRYKGAGDTFTRDSMPAETRESLGAVVDDLHAAVVAAVSARTDGTAEQAQALIDAGPYGSERARESGLIDDLEFDDEAREHARVASRDRAGADDAGFRVRRVRFLPHAEPASFFEILDALSGEEPVAPPEGDRLALVHLQGTITDGETARSGEARSGPFIAELRRIADEEEIRAVVLRVNSPGGSALASDRMWHAVERLAQRKPVVVSVGDMAASGGYYIAVAGTEIIAHPESLVGSIGVVGGKIDATGLAERVGVNAEIISRGEQAAWSSPLRSLDDGDREALERMLRSTYHRFLRRVAAGRDISGEELYAVAAGRIWSGTDAHEHGLIDSFGGLMTALARARELGELSDDAAVVVWPPRRSFVEALSVAMGAEETSTRTLLNELGDVGGPIGQAAVLGPLLFETEPVAVALPFVLDIR